MATRQKIRYSDCDPQGIVFNANYARYWDDAATDWFEEIGLGGPELGGNGVEVVTAHLEIDFKSAAKIGDTLETTIETRQFGTSSMTLDARTELLGYRTPVATGNLVYVFVDPRHFRPVAVPQHIRNLLEKGISAI